MYGRVIRYAAVLVAALLFGTGAAQLVSSMADSQPVDAHAVHEATAALEGVLTALRDGNAQKVWKFIHAEGKSLWSQMGETESTYLAGFDKRPALLEFEIVASWLLQTYTLPSFLWNEIETSPIIHHDVVAITVRMTVEVPDGEEVYDAPAPHGRPILPGPFMKEQTFHLVLEDAEWKGLWHPLFAFY